MVNNQEENDKNEISSQRKGLFYGGSGLFIIGLIMFLSAFIFPFTSFGQDELMNGSSSIMIVPFIGFIMIIVGNVLKTIGQKGLAGSGVILDPNQAREDLRPYSKQAGGMISDAMEEVDIIGKRDESLIKIRCRYCKGLNDESAKFCNHCGKEL